MPAKIHKCYWGIFYIHTSDNNTEKTFIVFSNKWYWGWPRARFLSDSSRSHRIIVVGRDLKVAKTCALCGRSPLLFGRIELCFDIQVLYPYQFRGASTLFQTMGLRAYPHRCGNLEDWRRKREKVRSSRITYKETTCCCVVVVCIIVIFIDSLHPWGAFLLQSPTAGATVGQA